LIDPDDQLRNALNLNNNKVLRCSGITLTLLKTEHAIKVIYHDEDGSTLSESFFFNHKKSRQRFNEHFGRRVANGTHPLTFDTPEDAMKFEPYFPAPDFVIAKKQKNHWQVSERLFDYQGPYRKANESH